MIMADNESQIIADFNQESKLFDESRPKDGISFIPGAPGGSALDGCDKLILAATKSLLNEKTDISDLFGYGENQGCKAFRNEMASFLTKEYGRTVTGDELMVTGGATHGLHFLMTLLVPAPCPVFVEDPTYYLGFRMLRNDLQRNVIPVSMDDEGIDVAKLEELLVANKPSQVQTSPRRPYWAAVYLIPNFHNPTSILYSHKRCEQLVRLARKHGVLLVAEDVYHVVHFSDSAHCPLNLKAFDQPTDPDYGLGHVITNGTFSKFLSPGLRLGWIEGPSKIVEEILSDNNYAQSGGSFNHFASKLILNVIQTGALKDHVAALRKLHKARMNALENSLRAKLPPGCSFKDPQGGFFLWLQLPQSVNGYELMTYAMRHHKLKALPGAKCSPTNSYKNFLRLSVSALEEDTIVEGATRLCQAIQGFLKSRASA